MKTIHRTLLILATQILLTPYTYATTTAKAETHAGYPDRGEQFDVLPGFKSPPAGYGEVPFYWWLGDTLTREHLTWHLDMLQNKGISSLQINYAHSDKGGQSWGLTIKSKPELFSEEWWTLFGWFMGEAKKRGMTVSLSDYTLGVGQESYVDEALREHPELTGHELHFEHKEFTQSIHWELPSAPLSLVCYRIAPDGSIIDGSGQDLAPSLHETTLDYQPSQAASYTVCAVFSRPKVPSFDPMNPQSGQVYIDHFFQKFEDKFPELSQGGLNFFFSDELNFQLGNLIWNDTFRTEFMRRKQYDIVPHLAALFTDIGNITPKVRLDYNDVMVSLSEEGFFRPVYEWHDQRGLLFGCDHGGRGRDVTEFGDYFRTQRWNQAPGCDQPRLEHDIIKNKVASSIAHLYDRPRTWLEGFYGSGWGTGSDALCDAIFSNFIMGHNLLSLHGLYYSTPGGWWEWAPPCNHFRMPYWSVMEHLLRCTERLSYLLSQGRHCADVALLYPTETAVAGNGKEATNTAFSLAERLYLQGIDFDFMDYESLQRCTIDSATLGVAGERYRILIIPAMKTLKHQSLETIARFSEAGGKVIAIGSLPEATDRSGRNDEQVEQLLNRIFGDSGNGIRLPDTESVPTYIDNAFPRDFKLLSATSQSPFVQHRRIGERDLYAVYNVARGEQCFFRCHGGAELWNPWTGETQPLPIEQQTDSGTIISMPLTDTEIQLIVFSPHTPTIISAETDHAVETCLTWDDPWTFRLKPVLDNRFGDFHWPASDKPIGAEIRTFDYSEDNADGTPKQPEWHRQTSGFGAKFLMLDALPHPLSPQQLLNANSDTLHWQPYEFSWRWGVEGDYGHQGYHGLKAEMYDDFIRLGNVQQHATGKRRVPKSTGNHYYLLTYIVAPHDGTYTLEAGDLLPTDAYINDTLIDIRNQHTTTLHKGYNKLLLHYDTAGTTHFVVLHQDSCNANGSPRYEAHAISEQPLAMQWNGDRRLLPFDIHPDATDLRPCIRFEAAPGIRSLTFRAYATEALTTANGIDCKTKAIARRNDGLTTFHAKLPHPCPEGASVSITFSNPQAGHTGGSLIPYPIEQECGEGIMQSGDWSQHSALQTYSGGAEYSREFQWNESTTQPTWLDLGEVATAATVMLNGKEIGTRLAPPYTFNITKQLKKGHNRLVITVYNTAANHYTTIPTDYHGDLRSGLIGPVSIKRNTANTK